MARRLRFAPDASWCRAWLLPLALTWCAVQAGAADSGPAGSILSPRGEEALAAGSSHVVRWLPLPAEVDEFEILLSLDGGASFPIRLTPQLDPSNGAYLWRVPDLPSHAARIRLRWGIRGQEIDGPPGPRFAIGAATWRTTSGLAWRHGEWWVTPHPSLVGLLPEHRSLRAGRGPGSAPPPLGSPQRGPWDPCPSREETRPSTSTGDVTAPAPQRCDTGRRPRFFPMRC